MIAAGVISRYGVLAGPPGVVVESLIARIVTQVALWCKLGRQRLGPLPWMGRAKACLFRGSLDRSPGR